jgi:hypothetical protein
LVLASAATVEDYNPNRNRTESHEVGYLSVFVVEKDSIRLDTVYRVPCYTEGIIKLRYTDKILALAGNKLYYDCVSDGYFTVIDIHTGQEITSAHRLEQDVLKNKIVSRELRNFSPTMELSTEDGRKHVLYFENLHVEPYDGENFNYDVGWGAPTGVARTADLGEEQAYFALNDYDNLSKLVVRRKKSGTSQSRLYTRGEALIHPIFLASTATGEAIHNENLVILHGKVWTDSQDRDLLSGLSRAGILQWTIPLNSLQCGENPDYYNAGPYMYVVGNKAIAVLDLQQGKVLKRYGREAW